MQIRILTANLKDKSKLLKSQKASAGLSYINARNYASPQIRCVSLQNGGVSIENRVTLINN